MIEFSTISPQWAYDLRKIREEIARIEKEKQLEVERA
jgi:hypothetical protein